MELLDGQCYETMRHSYRPSTLKNIKSQALIYQRFCRFYGLEMFPASAWQLIRYARYIANTVISYETVANYVSGVRKLHQLGGYEVPGPDEPNMQHFMRAIKRELAHPIKQAEPMTPDILKDIYNVLNLNKPYEIVCYTAILVGFYLFLRKSNLVPDGKNNFNPAEQLTRGDARKGKNMVLMVIRWSKTLQFQEKQLLLPLIPAKDVTICPVYWINYMCALIQAEAHEPLFCYPEKGKQGRVPVTYDQLRTQLRKWVAATGRNPEKFTLHGLRKGGANWALESGLVGEDLKLLGDWASDAYMVYLDHSLQRRVNNMVRFMECIV